MDRLRWGLLSTASIGRVVVDACRDSGSAEFVAVASRDAGRSRAFADEVGLARSFGSYEELLAADDVDVVYVALPSSTSAWTCRGARSWSSSGAGAGAGAGGGQADRRGVSLDGPP